MISIDDIVEALGDTETGKTFRELIEKSNFLETEFNFPGAKKSVTGQQILEHVKGIEATEGIGSIAAYDPTSGKILFDPTLTKKLSPALEQSGLSPAAVAKYLQEQFSFTTIHELGHAGADLAGIDSVEKRVGQTLGKQMPETVAKHIGEQEKIADSFAQEVFNSAGKDPSQYSYLTAAESVKSHQEVLLGRELTVDESLQLEDALRQNNIDPKSRIQLASYLEGDIQSEKLKVISDSYSYGEGVKIKSASLNEDLDLWGGPAQQKPTPQAAPSARVNPDDLWRDPDPTEVLKENPVVERVRKVQTKKSEPVVKVGKPVQTDSATATKVTQSGNATPPKAPTPTPAPKVQARLSSTAVSSAPSSGAPVKETAKLKSMADNTSAAVVKGAKNARNLKMLGVASLIGLGAAAYGGARKTQQDNIDRRLEMQRQGIIK